MQNNTDLVIGPSNSMHMTGVSFLYTLNVRPDKPTIVPSGDNATFFDVSTSPQPEQSNRSITFTDPFGFVYKINKNVIRQMNIPFGICLLLNGGYQFSIFNTKCDDIAEIRAVRLTTTQHPLFNFAYESDRSVHLTHKKKGVMTNEAVYNNKKKWYLPLSRKPLDRHPNRKWPP